MEIWIYAKLVSLLRFQMLSTLARWIEFLLEIRMEVLEVKTSITVI